MHKSIRNILYIVVLICAFSCKDSNEVPNTPVSGIPELNELSKLISQNPRSAEVYARRAAIYYENDGFDEAIADLRHAIDLDSTNIAYYHLLADCYMDYYRSKQALATMYRAAELAPERIPTLLKLSEFELITKQHKAALKSIDRILKLDPLNAEAFFMKGMVYRDIKETDKAVKSLLAAVEQDAELIDAWLMLGEIHTDQDDVMALKFFENALNIDPTNISTLHNLAFYKQNHNDVEGALELYRKINKINPQYSDAYFNAGILFLEMDSLGEAHKRFDITVKVNPTGALGYYYRGLASQNMGNFTLAIEDYEQALQFDPQMERAQKAIKKLKENK